MTSRRTESSPPLDAPKSTARSPRRSGFASVRVYDALRQQILDGHVPPGAHISHQSVASAMHTSNGPVITALRRLAHDGLVSYERGQGCRVADWDSQKLDDIMVVRRALETEAARLAARRSGPEDIERLRGIVARMEQLVAQRSRADADRADVELHIHVARLSRSPSLIEALNRCHLLEVVRRRLLANEQRGDFENLAINHAKLVDAIASGDPECAGRAMHDHLSNPR